MILINRYRYVYFICLPRECNLGHWLEIFLVIFHFLFWLFLYIFLNYLLRIDDSRCNKPCPSGAAAELGRGEGQLCGGDWALAVYFTGRDIKGISELPLIQFFYKG